MLRHLIITVFVKFPLNFYVDVKADKVRNPRLRKLQCAEVLVRWFHKSMKGVSNYGMAGRSGVA